MMVALIFQYIAAHWIEWLFAAISGALFAAIAVIEAIKDRSGKEPGY